MEKGQQLSITTIIIAALAIIVLVVLILIFSGRINVFSQDVEQVTTGNTCTDTFFLNFNNEKVLGEESLNVCPTGCHQVFAKTSSSEFVCCVDDTGTGCQ